MSQQNPTELARQGNPNAIAALINRNLKSKGIIAKVSREDTSLRILIEGDKLPHPDNLILFIRNGIVKLGVIDIITLQILGYKTGSDKPIWHETVKLEYPKYEPEKKPQLQTNLSKVDEVIPEPLKKRKSWIRFLDISVLIVSCFVGLYLGILISQIFGEKAPNWLRDTLAALGFVTLPTVVLFLKNNRYWNKIRFGIVTLLIVALVSRCGLSRTSEAVSTTSTINQVQNQSIQDVWHKGGTLHNSGVLEWQKAGYENKLATCADFVSSTWGKNLLKPSIHDRIKSMDDIKALSQELLTQMDIAMKEDPDPSENIRTYLRG